VYAEALATDAHVAVFGDASVGLAAQLIEQGARAVHVWDPDEARAIACEARSVRGVLVQAFDPGAPLRPADLVIVSDLNLFDDPEDLLARVRAMVGDDGAALVAARRDYYELFDLVAGEFACVRMIAELPFRGVAFVELVGEDEDLPGVSVDTRLAHGDRAPEAFVVVASQLDVRLDGYEIVELPPGRDEAARTQVAPAAPVAAAEPDPALVARATRLAAEVDDLTSRLADATTRLQQMTAHADALRGAAEAGQVAARRADEGARRTEVAERRLAELEGEIGRASEAHGAELARYEEALRERAQVLRTLEGELARRDRMVRDLAGALEEAHAASPAHPEVAAPPVAHATAAAAAVDEGALERELAADEAALQRELALAEENARLCARLDALALDLARREGEAHATAWSVTELERRLAQAQAERAGGATGKAQAGGADAADRLRTALDELDVLRGAMVREHAARAAAESGEALQGARAEIERQAVLLEQLSRELAARSSGAVGE
jgi:hypothetical protein